MKKRALGPGGFSLVEVVFALAVAAFCLVVLMGLIPVGLESYQQADTRSAMANLATMVVRDLQTTPSTTSVSPRLQFPIPAAGGTSGTIYVVYVDASGTPTALSGSPLAATMNAAPTSSSIYRITVQFYPPANASLKTATLARIWITFPAMADAIAAGSPTLPTKYSNMFETTISLNRN